MALWHERKAPQDEVVDSFRHITCHIVRKSPLCNAGKRTARVANFEPKSVQL